MKSYTLIFFIILSSIILCYTTANAQQFSTKNKKAIKLYQEANLSNSPNEISNLLKLAIKRDKKFIEAYMLLAKNYAMQDSMDKAINILTPICIEGKPFYSEILLNIANYQYLSGRYTDAMQSVASVTDMRFYDEILYLKDLYLKAIKLRDNPIPHKPINLKKVNTPYDDYFPSITADGKQLATTVLVPSQQGYNAQEDIYVSNLIDGEWSNSYPLSSAINTQSNEGAQTFSADGRYMFFISCGNNGTFGGCDIFYSIRQGRNWSRPLNLGEPANSEYWESNPVMSASGDKIYFTSNRPGGIGDRDIWSVDVKIQSNGILICSDAKSLGRPINTINGEWAPYIHADNQTLYFSSNGHGGLGRNDIFMSRKIKDQWTIPLNVGYPINTHGDESGLTVSGDGERAYFASDKLNGAEGLDIFQIKLAENCRPKPMSSKIGIVVDAKTYQPLQANVEIYDLKSNERFFESVSDKANGTFSVSLPIKGTFGLSVKKDDYLFYTDNIEEEEDTLRVLLKKIEEGSTFDLHNIYFALDSDSLLRSSTVEINRLALFLHNNPSVRIKIVGHTDSQGNSTYNKDLSKRRAFALARELNRKKRISRKRMEFDGLGDSQPIASNDTEKGRALNRRVEVIIIK